MIPDVRHGFAHVYLSETTNNHISAQFNASVSLVRLANVSDTALLIKPAAFADKVLTATVDCW